MNTQVATKAEKKVNAKPNPNKPGADQEKNINQLRQEIKNLAKAFNDMQQKHDMQAVIVMIPNKLLLKANAYLLAVSKEVGQTVTLSDLVSDAIDVYLWGEEENKRLEEERESAELENKE